MSHNASGHVEAVASTALPEKTSPDPIVADVRTFDIDSQDLPEGYFRSPYFIGTLVAAGLSLSAGAGTFALAAPVLGVINTDIGPDPNYLWVGLVYILTLALGQLLVGRLSDLFGRRWFFISGSVLSLVGCIVSAVATSIPMLIGGTTLIGFAAASQLSYPFVIGELVPFKHRFLSMGFVYCWGFPLDGFGPAVSYAFVQHSKHTWRSIYYLFIGINFLAVVFWFLFYFPPSFDERWAHKKTRRQVIQDFDFIGLILFCGSIVTFLMGISWGGALYPWKSTHVIATIIIGFLSLVAFVLYEIFAPLKEPLIPMHLFRNIRWVADIFMIALGASVYFCFAIVWPIMVFALYTSDLTKGGFLCCVTGLGTNSGQIVSGALGKRIGKQKYQLIVAATLMGLFLGAGACATPYNQNTIAALLFLGCFSMGWLTNIGLTISGIIIPSQAEIGTAIGVGACIRETVSTIAGTVYTVILANRLSHTIPAEVPPKLIAAGLPSSSVAAFLDAVAIGTPEAFSKVVGLTSVIKSVGIAAYKVASSHAYQTVFYSTIAFSALAIFCSLWVPNVDNMMTDRVVALLHKRKDEEAGKT